ncbi:hypothetical protein CANINC_003875 [Pichia inconspicua]|uniref:Adenylate cyclase n=1 Tax=Pichia inconspicua TaxID=52247 RepID=A0A4T0WXP3_9ASCO|nr:hypothetical protein CANINC_003875 [[Candida] inconspicua]
MSGYKRLTGSGSSGDSDPKSSTSKKFIHSDQMSDENDHRHIFNRFERPKFNLKYMENSSGIYNGNENEVEFAGRDLEDSINSNANHSITPKLAKTARVVKDKVTHASPMHHTKSATSLVSVRSERTSSSSSGKSSKRASLLNKLLPSRKESYSFVSSNTKSSASSVSPSSKIPVNESGNTLSSKISNTFSFIRPTSSELNTVSRHDERRFSSGNEGNHHRSLYCNENNKMNDGIFAEYHQYQDQKRQSGPMVRGRLPSDQQIQVQPLSKYHTFTSVSKHSAKPDENSIKMERATTLDSYNHDNVDSASMQINNSLAQSYGIQLDDLDTSDAVHADMTRVVSTASLNYASRENNSGWKAPESWKVRAELIEEQSKRGEISNSDVSSSVSVEDSNSSPTSAENSTLVISTTNSRSRNNMLEMLPGSFTSLSVDNKQGRSGKSNRPTKELSGSSKSSVRIFKGEKASLLPCELDTTASDILATLRRKRFLNRNDEHKLVLKCGGLTRTLAADEKPLKIQRKMLFLYGYTEKDNLDYIERKDLSFLFKFVVEEKGIEIISEERKRMINSQNVNLANWNLQDIPNFLYAEPIITLDVSQNPSLEFTNDFMHDSRNLTTLIFSRSGSLVFPMPIVNTPRLVNLDLEVNYIKMLPEEISKLQSLNSLNISCNRLSSLPKSFIELRNLQFLNLASNRFKSIPSQIFQLRQLKKLDLAYNTISEIPADMAKLENLETLSVAGNRLSGELPIFMESLQNLIKIDVRFNNLTSIDSLKSSPKLEVIRATGNNISVFRSKAPNLFEIEININPLTYVYFECDMRNLKVIDFSKGKLTSCSFTSRLVAAEKLILDHNHLSVLPDNFENMKSLQYLSIVRNNLTGLPNSLCKLKNLRTLDVHLNNIGKINENLWYLSNLEVLNLASNLLESFPDPPEYMINQYSTPVIMEKVKSTNTESDDDALLSDEAEDGITELPGKFNVMIKSRRMSENGSFSLLMDKQKRTLAASLTELCLCDNKLSDSVFSTISLFRNLKCLNLSYNDIFEIPSGYLSSFAQLRTLFLSGNFLSSLPVEDMDELKNIKTLHLNGNRFGTLPAELSKLNQLTSLDVGCNQLKYNIGNVPYDWNWCYNKSLRFLNFSGNKRLEIKPQQNIDEETGEKLDSFLSLKDLRMLGLMDVTITTDAVPDQSVGTRVRSTVSQLGNFGYGISDSLGQNIDALTTRDVVIEKFRGNSDEFLITIYDGKNSVQKGGDKISKIIQETFEIHLAEELETLGQIVVPGNPPKTVEDCLRGAFLTMNSEMYILINKDESSTFSSAAAHRTKTTDELTLEEDGLSGCSVAIIYIKKDYVYVANVGDIMGILTKSNGEFNVITTKHEPYAPKEYQRIRDSGGFVTTDGKLDGVSDVSRAVGFLRLMPHINAKPSIHRFKLTQNEEMIAICTSEIWKRVSYELAADVIRQEKSNPIGAAEKLRDFAISYGGKNTKLTAVVLSLRQFTTKQKHHSSSKPEDSTLRKLDDEIEPPTGDLAMVFTDIKNSTLLWDNYPAAMRSAIKVHNAIMRRQLRIIGGYEVKTEGDAFIVSFPTPTAALLWCFIVQQQLLTTNDWPAEILSSDQGLEIKDTEGNLIFRGLSVRMGIHWGTPVCEMDVVTKRMDYFGPMVNRASRVSAVADGGQITMSNDFYHELEKVRKIHKKIEEGKLDVNRAYGYKAKSRDVENQISQIENIVLVNKNGEIDNKSNQLTASGMTIEFAWTLRKIALRLEKVLSYLSAFEIGGTVNQYTKFTEDVKKEAEETMNEKMANVESFMLLLLDHTITRIENCVTVLGARQILSENFNIEGGTSGILDALKSLTDELLILRNKTQKINSQNLI